MSFIRPIQTSIRKNFVQGSSFIRSRFIPAGSFKPSICALGNSSLRVHADKFSQPNLKRENNTLKKAMKVGLLSLLTCYSLYSDEGNRCFAEVKPVTDRPLEEVPQVQSCSFIQPTLPAISTSDEDINRSIVVNKSKQIFQNYLTSLKRKYGEDILKDTTSEPFFSYLQQDYFSHAITAQQEDTMTFLKQVLQELCDSDYDKGSMVHYLNWSLTLSSSLFFQEYRYAKQELNDFFSKVINISPESFVPRSKEKRGRHIAFELQDGNNKETVALLKVVEGPRNAWGSVAPIMMQEGSAGFYELIGYFFAVTTGLSMTPTTIRGTAQINNESKDVVVQKFIPDCVTLSDLLLMENGAHFLMSLPIGAAQMIALSGMITGRLGGHLDNYLFHLQNGMIDKVYDIDLEEILPPCNRLERGMTLYPFKKDRNQNDRVSASDLSAELEEMAYQSTPLCRMSILGLPQNGKPFERACLMVITHHLIPSLLQSYHCDITSSFKIRQECLQAQMERLMEIQKVCKEQLELSEITLTPRDLYFHLFGGEHLLEIALKRGHPLSVIFNQVIGDPLQHNMIDFSDPESMPKCPLLDKSKNSRRKFFFDNLDFLDKQEIMRASRE